MGLGSHSGLSNLMPGTAGRLICSGMRRVAAVLRQACTPSAGSGQEDTCVLWTHMQAPGTSASWGICASRSPNEYRMWAATAWGVFVYGGVST